MPILCFDYHWISDCYICIFVPQRFGCRHADDWPLFALHRTTNETSEYTARMRKLIWICAGAIFKECFVMLHIQDHIYTSKGQGLTLLMLNKLRRHSHFIWLFNSNCWYQFTYWMIKSADPDQLLASSEANSFGSTLFHNKNTPVQIYRKFHLQILKIFR